MKHIYTIGHSNHTIGELIRILKLFSIDVVVDVRSIPKSEYNPHFNIENIEKKLSLAQIRYLHFGKEFGAKRDEAEAYTNGMVDFEKVKKLPNFLHGVQRISDGLDKNFIITLMCSEKDPLDCHRFSLISKALYEMLQIDIKHILSDGSVINHLDLIKEMLKNGGFFNFFTEDDERYYIDELFIGLGKKIAYQKKGII